MFIYLPCKLGETFIPRKFVKWANGKRVYENEKEKVLTGFFAYDCNTRCLAIPTIYTPSGFYSYDPEGEFSQEFTPKYKISLDVKSEYKLSEAGFPGNRTVRLGGLVYENGAIYADFITRDRAEHLRYPIYDTIQYAEIAETSHESRLEYCKKK